jgi:hypothetical protein
MIANWMKVVGVLSSGAVIATVMASEPVSRPTELVVPPVVKTTNLPKAPKLSESTKLPDLPKIPSVTKTEKRDLTADNSGCHPGYSGCLKQNAGDYDCAGGSGNGPNYTGPVKVSGSDPFDLDRDNDGMGCE